MAQHSSYEAMALHWAELCNDPLLHDMPGKIELNSCGVIELNPASALHARFQAAVADALADQMPCGVVLTEAGIATTEGVRAPDVAWCSAEFDARHGDRTPLPQAPEICVEVRSPSNTNDEMTFKTSIGLAAGAVEVWVVAVHGNRQVWDAQGLQPTTRYPVSLTLQR